MVKDGTNRGGRRVRAGAKPDPLNEKLAVGRTATRCGSHDATALLTLPADLNSNAPGRQKVKPRKSVNLAVAGES